MLNETLLCVSLHWLIEGLYSNLMAEKCWEMKSASHTKPALSRDSDGSLLPTIHQCSHTHVYTSSYTPKQAAATKNSFWIFSIWAWLWPLMPNSTSKSECGQFGQCTMGYHKSRHLIRFRYFIVPLELSFSVHSSHSHSLDLRMTAQSDILFCIKECI